MTIKEQLFEDIALTQDSWTNEGVKALLGSSKTLDWIDDVEAFSSLSSAIAGQAIDENHVKSVMSELLRGQIVSLLSILDGSSELSETHEISLVNDKGENISNDLHTEFVSHLIETGRLD